MKKIKKNFVINIDDEEKISIIENKICEYGTINFWHTGDLYSTKYELKLEDCIFDIIGFQFEADSQEELDEMLSKFSEDLDELNVNYKLKDFDTNELIESVYFECREEIIVHFTSTNAFNEKLLRKIHIIKNLPKNYEFIGANREYEKITIKNSTDSSRGFISITIKLYSLLDDDLKNLEQQVINELEKLNEDFELEINHLD